MRSLEEGGGECKFEFFFSFCLLLAIFQLPLSSTSQNSELLAEGDCVLYGVAVHQDGVEELHHLHQEAHLLPPAGAKFLQFPYCSHKGAAAPKKVVVVGFLLYSNTNAIDKAFKRFVVAAQWWIHLLMVRIALAEVGRVGVLEVFCQRRLRQQTVCLTP